MGNTGETRSILAAARRYVISKSDDGVTVGLHFEGDRYGEARSPAGDLDDAVREAFHQIMIRQPDAVAASR
jgi:hypothetical protein